MYPFIPWAAGRKKYLASVWQYIHAVIRIQVLSDCARHDAWCLQAARDQMRKLRDQQLVTAKAFREAVSAKVPPASNSSVTCKFNLSGLSADASHAFIFCLTPVHQGA